MFSENEKLLIAILIQMDIGKLTIDWDQLTKDTGATSKQAAQVRWYRYKSKLLKGADTSPDSPEKPIGVLKQKGKAARGRPKKSKKEEKHDSDLEEDDVSGTAS